MNAIDHRIFDTSEPASAIPNVKMVVRRYTFKLYPNKTKMKALQRQASLLAMLWNAALEQREIQWAHQCQRNGKGDRKGLSKYDQGRELKIVRANDPEYASMSSDTMNLCLIALDDAFRAFFKRAKGGAGKSSGYPRYKSPYAIENKNKDCTIWHRDEPKGWRMTRDGKHFRIHAHGITNLKDRSTWIKARGRFPVDFDDVELRDMRIIRVSGVWYCSIVVKMEPRMDASPMSSSNIVRFDLIDEFARVENRATGECLSCCDGEFYSSEEKNTVMNQGDVPVSGRDTLDLSGDDRKYIKMGHRVFGRDTLDLAPNHDADAIQSEGDRRYKKFSYRWKQAKRRVARRRAKEARRRKEALHRWTTSVVKRSLEMEVIAPPIKESTKTARGDEKDHGAAVKTVAALNRHILSQAPSMAIAMLQYKCEEAGVPFCMTKAEDHKVTIGGDLQVATKAVRKVRRQLKKMESII